MKASKPFTAASTLLLLARTTLAAEDDLPAPVLQWSLYVLLFFALVVAIGIFFKKENGKKAPLGNLLDQDDGPIHWVDPGTSVTECVRQMNANRIGAMLVMEGGRLVGIFTERDAMTKVLGVGLEPTTTPVAEVMSTEPTCVTPSTTLEDAMSIVTHQRIRHLPVVQNGKVLGMISSGDLTHWLVADRSGEIRELVDVSRPQR